MKLMLSTFVATALIATACGEVAPEPRGAVTSGCVGKSASSPVCQPGALPQSSNTETNDGNNKTRTTQTQTKKDSVVPSDDENETLTPETKKAAQKQNNSQNGNQNGNQNILGGVVGSVLPTFQKVGENFFNGLFNKPSQQQSQNQPTKQQQAQPSSSENSGSFVPPLKNVPDFSGTFNQPALPSGFPQQAVAPQAPVAPAATCPSTCNKTELNTCLRFGGGDACFPKWKCTTACR